MARPFIGETSVLVPLCLFLLGWSDGAQKTLLAARITRRRAKEQGWGFTAFMTYTYLHITSTVPLSVQDSGLNWVWELSVWRPSALLSARKSTTGLCQGRGDAAALPSLDLPLVLTAKGNLKNNVSSKRFLKSYYFGDHNHPLYLHFPSYSLNVLLGGVESGCFCLSHEGLMILS